MENSNNKSNGKTYAGTIDCTPTWEGILPLLLDGIKSDNPTVYNNSFAELKRMAAHADKYNSILKEIK